MLVDSDIGKGIEGHRASQSHQKRGKGSNLEDNWEVGEMVVGEGKSLKLRK